MLDVWWVADALSVEGPQWTLLQDHTHIQTDRQTQGGQCVSRSCRYQFMLLHCKSPSEGEGAFLKSLLIIDDDMDMSTLCRLFLSHPVCIRVDK